MNRNDRDHLVVVAVGLILAALIGLFCAVAVYALWIGWSN